MLQLFNRKKSIYILLNKKLLFVQQIIPLKCFSQKFSTKNFWYFYSQKFLYRFGLRMPFSKNK